MPKDVRESFNFDRGIDYCEDVWSSDRVEMLPEPTATVRAKNHMLLREAVKVGTRRQQNSAEGLGYPHLRIR